MYVTVNALNPELVRYRLTIVLVATLILFLAVSLTVFFCSEQWTRRVLFFPLVNSPLFAAEIRYFPDAPTEAENIRRLLEDYLLGPSNFGTSDVLPPKTRLLSAMLSDGEFYAGFSEDIFQADACRARPRERLQAVANAIYFNFPGVSRVHFFVQGKELADTPILHQVDRKLDLARTLVPAAGDLRRLLKFSARHPLLETSDFDRFILTFHGGASWDERILK